MTSLIKRTIGLFDAIPYSLAAILARFSIGMVFWLSGRTKVDGWNIFAVNDKAISLFENIYNLPVIPPLAGAHLAAIAEHVLPIMLWIGLGTRFAALGLLGMTLTIEIFVFPEAYVLHGTWASILLFLIKFGPGKISLDHILKR